MAKKLPPELAQFIADQAAAGIPLRLIAEAIGRSYWYVSRMLKHNKLIKQMYGEASIRETRKRLEKVSPEWWLERVHPEYRLAKQVDLQGNLILNSLAELKRRLDEHDDAGSCGQKG